MKTTGDKIKYFRKRAKLSQMDLEVAIGNSQGSISRIENGDVNPTKETLVKIIDVLNLKPFEASILFGIETDMLAKVINLAKDLSETFDLDLLLQKSVDLLAYELNFLAIVIFLVEGDKVYSKTVTNRYLTTLFFKLLPVAFPSLSVSLTKDTNNYIVRTINEKKSFYSLYVADFAVPALSKSISRLAQKITGHKSALSLPIIYEGKAIGALMFAKNYIDDFENERQILEAFTEHIAVSIVKAKKYKALHDELTELKGNK